MLKHFLLICAVFLTGCLLSSCNRQSETQPAANTQKDGLQAQHQTQPMPGTQAKVASPIKWVTIEELEALSAKEPRKVVVDLYTDWCGWCKRMDASTFQDAALAEYINENFYAVKFNAERKDPISFKGKQYVTPNNSVGRSTNPLTYKLILGDKPNGRVGYPSFAFLDEKLNRIDAIAGYRDAAAFLQVVKNINEGKHKPANS